MNAAMKRISERVYRLSDEEKAAIEAARRSGLASDDGVAAFWSRYGVA